MPHDTKHMRVVFASHPKGGLQTVISHDFSPTTMAGLTGPKVDAFKKWRDTGYHPDLMPVGQHGLTKNHLNAARALYSHLDPKAVNQHVADPTVFDPLGVNNG